MSKEAMKLALEALESGKNHGVAIDVLRRALAEQPAQPKGCQCPACKIAPHASDCPVHNEPAWPNGPCDCGAQPEQEPKLPEFYARFEDGVVSVYQRREDETPLLLLRENLPGKQPAQQEPVAWIYSQGKAKIVSMNRVPGVRATPLYTSPPPQRKPLTDEQIDHAIAELGLNYFADAANNRAVLRELCRKAAHGIKEKT